MHTSVWAYHLFIFLLSLIERLLFVLQDLNMLHKSGSFPKEFENHWNDEVQIVGIIDELAIE